jgi:hypothetical protein
MIAYLFGLGLFLVLIFVGLVHFGTGFILTYPPFIIGATS